MTSLPKIKTEGLRSRKDSLSDLTTPYSNNNDGDTPAATPRSNPWRNEKDRQDAKRMIPYLAGALLLPLSISNIYFSLYYHVDGDEHDYHVSDALFHVGYFILTASTLAFVADKFPGEVMIATIFMIGLLNEIFDLGMNKAAYAAVTQGVGWVFVALTLGAVSGAICKAKDIIDGRFRKEYSFTERLYLMIPYVVGVWVGHILVARWGGLLTVFSSIFFLEAVVGYGIVALKIFRQHGVGQQGDLLSVFRTLANASFGKVFAFGILFSLVFFYMLAPSWSDLSLRLPHTLLSAVCIITEVAVYDWVA